MDYTSLMDLKTRKQLLSEAIENQKNKLKYELRDMDNRKAVEIMEDLYATLNEFIKNNLQTSGSLSSVGEDTENSEN